MMALGPDSFAIRMTPEAAARFKKAECVVSIRPFHYRVGEQVMPVANIFPNDLAHYHWNIDNMGPIHIPGKGDVLILNVSTLAQYSRIIGAYEGNKLETRDGKIYINGKEATQYTCHQNYYWMMGDNRHNSADSRFWGFVPEDHLEAKATRILMNTASDQNQPRSARMWMPLRQ